MYDLGLILRTLREQRRYTQEQLGKKINKSKAIISRYEKNYQMPTLEILIYLAKLYNVSLDYLAGIKPAKTFTTDNLTPNQEKLINELIFEFNCN